MSYILEALKKAEADRERGRGAVPGLQAQTAAPGSDMAVAATIPWRWLGGGAALAFGAVLAWNFGRPDAPPATPMAPAPVEQLAQGQPSSKPVPAPPAPPVNPPAAPPANPVGTALAPLEPPASPERNAASEAAVAVAAETLPKPPLPAATARVRAVKPPPVTTVAPAAPAEPASRVRKLAPPQPAERPPSLANLPEELRRQVPPIGIGGSVYSALPANRMLIVNGQVLREGGTVAAGLQLEQIGPKAAVFSIHGQRFEVPL